MNVFADKLNYSLGEQQNFDIQILKSYIPHCVEIRKSNLVEDRNGVDYVAILKGGSKILIDAKTREKGAKRFWKRNEPELALEVYSVVENNKIGWTLNTSSNVDYILYTFDKDDSNDFYFLPFQMLRKAFLENGKKWKNEYGIKNQASDTWHSSAIFVPASKVINAISEIMIGKR